MEYKVECSGLNKFVVIKKISLTGKVAEKPVCEFSTYVEAYQVLEALTDAFNTGRMLERIDRVKARLAELKSK